MSNSLATPWTVACQAFLSMGFPRQEHWSGLPFPSPVVWFKRERERDKIVTHKVGKLSDIK